MDPLPRREARAASDGRPVRPRGLYRNVNPLRVLLFGRPIATEHQEEERLPKVLALPIFSSDAISSVAYATQEILLVLGMAGLWMAQHRPLYTQMTIALTAGIVILLFVVVTSYWQTIYAYPSGGGSYIVSKENLGTYPGLIAGAALLIDYVLTVAVSIASGVQNLLSTPLMASLHEDTVLVCALCIAFVAFANLRGVRESGVLFAIPTYLFAGMACLMVFLGLLGPSLVGWTVLPLAVNQTMPPGAATPAADLTPIALFYVALRAFANGCSAMTGTEAISNGVPAFKRPESRNAARTLLTMAVILGILFLGVSALATRLHVVYWHVQGESSPAVIDQLAGAVFGKSSVPWWRLGLYYTMQFSTMLILVLAANTSFAGFPRLAAILSRDRFLPRQLSNQGDKLVFSNGIVVLGACAIALVVGFHGSVDRLIPLYAVGVFTAFTLSQSGMVRHWAKERGSGWQMKALINGFGAVCTFVVLAIILVEKLPEGAWLVVVVAAALVFMFQGIWHHYEFVRRHLSLLNREPDRTPVTNTVIVLVPSLHQGVFPAINYARAVSADCRAVHIEINPDDTPRLRREWEQYVGDELPLVILPSPYRSLIGPLLAYLTEVRRERANHMVTVVVPEFVSNRWWHSLLHNSSALLIKLYLLGRPGVVVSNVRYFLDAPSDMAPLATPPAPDPRPSPR